MEPSQPIRGKALTNHNFITHIFSCTVWAFYHILSEFSLAPCVVYCGADLFLSAVINVVGFAYEKFPYICLLGCFPATFVSFLESLACSEYTQDLLFSFY